MSKAEEWKKWEGRVVDGKFPLRQWLGGSDHSAVFLTERPGKTQKVAIKLIAADSDADRQLSRWRVAAQLSHPNLMRVFEAGRCQVDGTPTLYLLMEYAEEDLSQILPQRPLAPSEVTDLLPALLDALSYLHGKGLVHGRVKPSNVQAMGDELKLSADQIAPFAEPGSAGRRDVYDAPEAAAGMVSQAGDVWSIGVTLVAALTQNISFLEAAPEVPETATAQPDPEPQHAVPQPFRGIARECLHLDPKRRCSIAEIQARLQPEGRSVPAEPEAAPPPKRPVSRNLIFGIFLAMAMLAGFVVFHSRGKDAVAPVTATSDQPVPQVPPQAAPAAAANPPAHQPMTAPTPQPPKKATPTRGEVAHQVLPDVPQSARNTITGTIKVNVQVDVDSSGKVTAAKLTHPGPSQYFARLALKAAQQWEFSPPAADGAAASAWSIQFRFKRTSLQASAQPLKH